MDSINCLLPMYTYQRTIKLSESQFDTKLDYVLQTIQVIETSMRQKHYGSSLTLANIKFFLYNSDKIKRAYHPNNVNNSEIGFTLWEILPMGNLWLHTYIATVLGFDLSEIADTTSEIECATWKFKDDHEFAMQFAQWIVDTFANHGITFIWKL
jgi:hypothetical protein